MTEHSVPRYRVTSDGLIMFEGTPPSIPLAGLTLVHEADYLALASNYAALKYEVEKVQNERDEFRRALQQRIREHDADILDQLED